MDAMIVKPVYLPSIEVAIEDNEGNFAFAKGSPIAVNLNQNSRILHCNLTWIDCKIETIIK